MSEEIIINASTKEEKYKELLPQIKALIEDEKDLIANFANVSAALKYTFDFFWVGFYVVKHEQLVLGPFQGPIACTRINKGQGVCGTAWLNAQVIVVPDVEEFPGHIACASASKSEIVLPVKNQAGAVTMVLDVDSDQLNDFSDIDQLGLEKILGLISEVWQ